MACSYDDFLGMGRSQLVDFLHVRGLVTSGRKVELVARAFTAVEMQLPIKLSTEEHQKLLTTEYQKRLVENNISDPKDHNIRQDDITKCPPVNVGHIFEYILRLREFDSDYIGKYKDMKAYSYFDSGFVDTILHSFVNTENNLIILFCSVTGSMDIHNSKELWICVEGTGRIRTAWCSCMAGTSACCNHIIATLYKVEYAHREGYIDPSCTSIPCGWNAGTKKEVSGRKIQDLVLRKRIRTKLKSDPASQKRSTEEERSKALRDFDPRLPRHRESDDDQIKLFYECLAKNPMTKGAVLFKSIEATETSVSSEKFVIEQVVEKVMDLNVSNEERVSTLFEQMAMTQDECTKLEMKTRDQSSSELWVEARKGRLTASKHREIFTKVSSVTRATGSIKPRTTPMAAEIIFRENNISNLASVRWGIENEQSALKYFYAKEGVLHTNFGIKKCGLFVDGKRPYIGASPDAIMECKCHGKSVVEIKCPYSIKDSHELTPEVASKVDFLTVDPKICLKKSHKYYTQLNSQMALTGAKHGYFVVWTPADTLIEKIDFDLAHWTEVAINLEIFFKEYVIKHYLGISPISFCGCCGKFLLQAHEIKVNERDTLSSVMCDRCQLHYHFSCEKKKPSEMSSDMEYLCMRCLNSIFEDDMTVE